MPRGQWWVMTNMLKVPAIKLGSPVTLVVGIEAFDSTFHPAILMDINYARLRPDRKAQKCPTRFEQ